MTAKKDCVRLHLDVERVYSEGENIFDKKDDGGIKLFAHTMMQYTLKLLDFFLSSSLNLFFDLLLRISVDTCVPVPSLIKSKDEINIILLS